MTLFLDPRSYLSFDFLFPTTLSLTICWSDTKVFLTGVPDDPEKLDDPKLLLDEEEIDDPKLLLDELVDPNLLLDSLVELDDPEELDENELDDFRTVDLVVHSPNVAPEDPDELDNPKLLLGDTFTLRYVPSACLIYW